MVKEARAGYHLTTPLPKKVLGTDIRLSEVLGQGVRFEASAFNLEARAAVERMRASGLPLIALYGRDGLCPEAHNAFRFRRVWVDEAHGVPFLSSSDIISMRPQPKGYLSRKHTKRLAELLIKPWDVLISRSGTIGNVGLATQSFKGMALSEDAIRLRAGDSTTIRRKLVGIRFYLFAGAREPTHDTGQRLRAADVGGQQTAAIGCRIGGISMKTLFVAWQDPKTRRWLPVGRLSREDNDYRFVYTRGAQASERFVPFGRMINLHDAYVAKELFPLFANRLLPKSRPEYRDFLRWLGLEDGSSDALEQLSRSGGVRATDSLQVFPCPEPTQDNHYVIEYFSHGIRHMPPDNQQRIKAFQIGERLFLMKDIQNPFDEDALLMRTGDPIVGVGYCPRFYSAEFTKLVELVGKDEVSVTVAAINLDAPLQFRLRCRLTAPWPAGFSACEQETFEPLAL